MASRGGRGRVAAARHDGRSQRGADNRARILQAIYELVRSGNAQPTADEVAARAQVGQRTVFRHFADMESLRGDMAARVEAELRPILLRVQPRAATPAARLRALIARRLEIYEHLAPFRRAGVTSPRSATVQRGRAMLDVFLRSELEQSLAGDLDGVPHDLIEALDLLTSFEAWERLRGIQQLDRAQAIAVMTAAALTLLAAGRRAPRGRHGGPRSAGVPGRPARPA